MTSSVKTSRGMGCCSTALVVATIFAQSAFAQAPAQSAAAPSEPLSAPAQPAAAPSQPAAALAQPVAVAAEPEASNTFILREDKMVSQFLLAIAVFFAVIAFLLLVSLPPRNAGDES